MPDYSQFGTWLRQPILYKSGRIGPVSSVRFKEIVIIGNLYKFVESNYLIEFNNILSFTLLIVNARESLPE